jgi:hypothetical protein
MYAGCGAVGLLGSRGRGVVELSYLMGVSMPIGAGTVREEDVKDFLDRAHCLNLTRGDHSGG